MKKNNSIHPLTSTSIVVILALVTYAAFAANDMRRHENVVNLNTQRWQREAASDIVTIPQLPDGVGRLLGNRDVFYGPQLTGDEFHALLVDFDIAHVVDLAHEAKAEAILDGETERAICARFSTQYHAYNIEGRNNRLNQQVMSAIDSLVELRQPIYIHCRNGLHRAKVTAGRAYARDGYKWETIVDLLRWAPVVADSKYDRYTNDLWEYSQGFNHPLNVSK